MKNELIQVSKFHEHMNLSFKTVVESFNTINLQRSLLNGTIIKSIKIKDCNFKMSEWSGAQVLDVSIESCDFKYSEIKSTWFRNTNFINITFDDAIISDCTFTECNFIDCKFSGTLLQENTFNKCNIKNLSFGAASANLNTFNNTQFVNVDICGSFYYSFFVECVIENCRIDEYLLGYILGIYSSKLSGITYLKNNRILDLPFEDLITDLISEYEQRMKFVNVAILKLNLNETNNLDKLILSCIKAFTICCKNNITISLDDIKFIKTIIERYYERKLISPCMILEAINLIQYELQNYNSVNNQNQKQLKELFNCLFFCLQNFLVTFQNRIKIDRTTEYVLFIKYNQKPLVETIDVIKSLMSDYKIKPEIIKTKQGSFLEWIKCDGNAAIALEVLFGFLNISIPIVYDIIKEKVKKTKKTNNDNKNNCSKNIELESKNNFNITIQINPNNYNIQNFNNLVNTINQFDFTVSNDFKGYNNDNIQEIRISN